MVRIEQKIYIILIPVFLSLLFFLPATSRAATSAYGCPETIGDGCTDVSADTYEQAREQCRTRNNTWAYRVPCAQVVKYGCVDQSNGTCSNVKVEPAVSYAAARSQCLTGPLLKAPCFMPPIPTPAPPTPNEYACFDSLERQCTNLRTDSWESAEQQCLARENTHALRVSCNALVRYGCVDQSDGTCSNVIVEPSVSYASARSRCLTGPLLRAPCYTALVLKNFGCMDSRDRWCTDISTDTYEKANSSCRVRENKDAFRTSCSEAGLNLAPANIICETNPGPSSTIPRCATASSSRWGCIKSDESCGDITANSIETATAQCRATYGTSRVDALGCGPEKTYACFTNGAGCEDVTANTFAAASNRCNNFCKGQQGKGCYVDFEEPCATSKLQRTSSTEVVVLKEQAAQVLNPAKIISPTQFIERAINILMAFMGSITLVLYVVAGFLWMTGRGNSEQADKAKKILVWTTLGAFVMLFSYILVNFLFNSIA